MTARPVSPAQGWPLLRASALAVTTGGSAIVAHCAAGGGPPDAGLAVLVCVCAGVGWVAVAGVRRRRPTVTLIALGSSQLTAHLALSLPHSVPAHHHHPSGPVPANPAMLVAHALAVVLTGLLLNIAGAVLIAAAAVLAVVLPRRPLRLAAYAPLWIAIAADADHIRGPLLTRICVRRGPPA